MKKISFLFCLIIGALIFNSCQKEEIGPIAEMEQDNCNCQHEVYSQEIGEVVNYGVGENAMSVTNYDGVYVFEGDVILTEAQLVQMTAKGEEGTVLKSTGRSSVAARWPNKKVPYVINSSLPNKRRVTDAIAHWESKTNFDFVPRSNEKNYIEFVKGTGCSSYVGMIGGRQPINLANGCSKGNTIHEIGHAIGLWHEHSRADRAYDIEIKWENISAGREHNFKAYNLRGYSGFDHGEFDFGSIMLYGSFAFSKNGEPTITKKGGTTFTGQRTKLSNTDVSGAHFIYKATNLAAPRNVVVSHDGDETLTMTWNAVSGAAEYWIYTLYPKYDVQPKLYRIRKGTSYKREMKKKFIKGYRLWVCARDANGNTGRAVEATWK